MREESGVFKRHSVFAGCIFLTILLTGCNHDEKYAANIYNHLEQAAKLESAFAKKQEVLRQSNEKEQKTYREVLDRSITEEDQITGGIKSAKKENQLQEELLRQAKQEFDKAFDSLADVRTNIDHIKDKKQKEAAAKILDLAKQRNQKLEAYYQEYAHSIKISDRLYEDMLENDFSADKLDSQIKKLNQQYKNMQNEATAFNKATKNYNQAKSSYYQLANLDSYKIKQAQT